MAPCQVGEYEQGTGGRRRFFLLLEYMSILFHVMPTLLNQTLIGIISQARLMCVVPAR